MLSCANLAQASFSTSYEVNEESLSYGSNAEFLQSSSYMMDLGDLSWVDRTSESSSYRLIDGNSMLDVDSVTPPTPPPPSGGGGGGGTSPVAGGKDPVYDQDSPVIVASDQMTERELNDLPDQELHGAPEEKPIQLAYVPDIVIPAPEFIEEEKCEDVIAPPSGTSNIINNYYINKADGDSDCGCFRWDFVLIFIILCITLILITGLTIWGKQKK